MARTPKKNNMSVAFDEDMQEFLKDYIKANNIQSVSKLLRDLVDTYIKQDRKITVVHHDVDHIPVVLKIPVALRGDREAVRSWLKVKTDAIVDRLSYSTETFLGAKNVEDSGHHSGTHAGGADAAR